ncbi:MAG: GreA/GreB family elongation factor [Cyclobacteriaceae bacterium]
MKKRLITIDDYERLMAIKDLAFLTSENSENVRKLYMELTHAHTLKPGYISESAITMNSEILLRELNSYRQIELTLTYPRDSNLLDRKVSVFSDIGMALLGRLVGDRVSWNIKGRNAKFEIIEIIYQPEAVGHFHL